MTIAGLLSICAAVAETDFIFSRIYWKSGYETESGLPSGVSLLICTNRSGLFTGRDCIITALIKVKMSGMAPMPNSSESTESVREHGLRRHFRPLDAIFIP